MSVSVPIQSFLSAAESLPVIDVRSPSEFKQGHIPGAHNIPLFDDEERAEIGTLYKQKNRDAAVKRGLEIVGPRMRAFVEQSEEIAPERKVLLHCWRGGMRSSSFAWLLETVGFEVQRLERGYKAFRNFVLNCFSDKKTILILSGYTGSGKTEILKAICDLGEQVIDLEGLACHKGSAFGHLGENDQPTGEQFENKLAMKWHKIDEHQPVWLEDESRFIGRRIIPQPLFKQMQCAPVICIEVAKKTRINRLVNEYGAYSMEELGESVKKIKKRLGGLRTKQAVQALENDNLAKVVDLVLYYYDKAYDHQIKKREDQTNHLRITETDPLAIARILVNQNMAKTASS